MLCAGAISQFTTRKKGSAPRIGASDGTQVYKSICVHLIAEDTLNILLKVFIANKIMHVRV